MGKELDGLRQQLKRYLKKNKDTNLHRVSIDGGIMYSSLYHFLNEQRGLGGESVLKLQKFLEHH